jgi:hypothetical protein
MIDIHHDSYRGEKNCYCGSKARAIMVTVRNQDNISVEMTMFHCDSEKCLSSAVSILTANASAIPH